jgi:hypothetical protein
MSEFLGQPSKSIGHVGENYEISNGFEAKVQSFKEENGIGEKTEEETTVERESRITDLESQIKESQVKPIEQRHKDVLDQMGFFGQLKTEIIGGTPEETSALKEKKRFAKETVQEKISPEVQVDIDEVKQVSAEKGEFHGLLTALPKIIKPLNEIEVKRNAVARVQQAFVGAGADLVQGLGNTAIDVGNGVDSFLKSRGYTKKDFIPNDARLTFANDYLASPQTTGDAMARTVLQYVIPYSAASGAMSKLPVAGKVASSLAIGAGIDFIARDPEEKRLSDFAQKSPIFSNPLSAILASDPTDSKLQSRLKNAVEGTLLNVAGEGAIHLGSALYSTVRGVKNARYIDGLNAELIDKVDAAEKTIPLIQKTEEPVAAVVDGEVKFNTVAIDKVTNAKKFLKDFMNKNPELKGQGVREYVSVPEMKAAGADLSSNPAFVEQVLSAPPGTAWSGEELYGIEVLLKAAANDLKDKHKLLRSGKMSEGQYNDVVNKLSILRTVFRGSTGEAGRAEGALSHMYRDNDDLKQALVFGEIAEMHGGKEQIYETAMKIDEVFDLDPSQLHQVGDKFLKKTFASNMHDSAHSLYISGILSSPKTAIVNVGAGLLRAPMEMAERGIASIYMLGAGPKNKITLREVSEQAKALGSESWNQLMGGFSGIYDGLLLAGHAVKKGEFLDYLKTIHKVPEADMRFASFLETKQVKPVISSAQFGYDGPGKDVIDAIGSVLSTPTMALVRGDQAIGAIHYRMEARALAAREASSRGLSGEEATKLIRQLSDDPIKDLPLKIGDYQLKNRASSIRYRAGIKAEVNKFTSELTGVGKSVNEAINGTPGGKWIIPFSKVDINITQQIGERVPTALFTKRYAAAIADGGANAAQARAKVTLGTAMMTLGGYLSAQGYSTGSGPRNREARQYLEENTQFQPHSIRVGDTFVRHDRIFEPFSTLLSLSSDLMELHTYAADTNHQEEVEDLVVAAGAMVAEHLTPEFMTSNLSDLIDLLQTQDSKKVGKVVGNITTGMVPFSGALRDIRKSGIPYVVPPDDVRRITASGFRHDYDLMQTEINRIKDIIPGLSSSLPPRRNMFGDVVHYPPGLGPDLISPIASMEYKEDIVTKEFVRLGISGPIVKPKMRPGQEYLRIDMPDKFISVGRGISTVPIQMTPQQYDKYVMLSAGIGLRGRIPLKEKLENTITSGYPELGSLRESSSAQSYELNAIINNYRSAGMIQLQLEDVDIRTRSRELQRQAVDEFRGLSANEIGE